MIGRICNMQANDPVSVFSRACLRSNLLEELQLTKAAILSNSQVVAPGVTGEGYKRT